MKSHEVDGPQWAVTRVNLGCGCRQQQITYVDYAKADMSVAGVLWVVELLM